MAACSPAAPVRIEVPSSEASAACERLGSALDELDNLDGRERRVTVPDSVRTAAWGEPAVRLRCGVPRPGALTPTTPVVEIDGVEWFIEETPRAFRFTTVNREAYVEVRVPGSTPRTSATNPLVDLAPAVASSVARG